MNRATVHIPHIRVILVLLMVLLSAGVAVNADARQRRPSLNAQQCFPDAGQLNAWGRSNPRAMEICLEMIGAAKRDETVSFAFMCDDSGYHCCNDDFCEWLGSVPTNPRRPLSPRAPMPPPAAR